jgi:co-chaperonin GroES (HSP10)
MYGNIIVPDAGKEKPLMGEVIASGPGIINLNGVLIPNLMNLVKELNSNALFVLVVEKDGEF